MDAEKLLRNLIKQEENKDRKYILFMLLKFFELVKVVESKDDYLPLIILQNDHLMLVYKDDEINDMEYIFTDYEEILYILQKTFYDGKHIYFYCDTFEESLTKEEIMGKIDEAIAKNDKEMFEFYAAKFIE